MKQEAFLSALEAQLAPLPPQEREQYLGNYREMILDRIEDGASEEDAIASLGPPEEIARQILSEVPLSTLVKARVRPVRKLRGWEITLLILGFPLWFPLLVAAAAVLFALFVSVCAVLFSLISAGASIALSGPVAAASGIVQLCHGLVGEGLITLGCGLLLLGLGVLLFYGACRLAGWFFRSFSRLLRRLFTKKEVVVS